MPIGRRHRTVLRAQQERPWPAASIGIAAMSAAFVATNRAKRNVLVGFVIARWPQAQGVCRGRDHAQRPWLGPPCALDNAASISHFSRARGREGMSDAINTETFAPYIGRRFRLPTGRRSPGRGRSAPIAAADASPRRVQLLLRGAPAPIAPEGMHGSRSRTARASSSISFPSTRHRAIIKTIRSSSIDPRPGVASVPRRKDSLERDAVVKREERHAVLVRLSAGRRERPHRDRRGRRTVDVHRGRARCAGVARVQE